MVKLVDTQVSGTCGGNPVEVQVLSSAPDWNYVVALMRFASAYQGYIRLLCQLSIDGRIIIFMFARLGKFPLVRNLLKSSVDWYCKCMAIAALLTWMMRQLSRRLATQQWSPIVGATNSRSCCVKLCRNCTLASICPKDEFFWAKIFFSEFGVDWVIIIGIFKKSI